MTQRDVPAKGLAAAFLSAMESYDARACFHLKRGELYKDITYPRFKNLTFRLVKFFRQQGFDDGKRIALVADNAPEWMAASVAALLVGAVVVPLRVSLAPEMLRALLRDAGAVVALMDGTQRIREVLRDRDALPDLEMVLALSPLDEPPDAVRPLAEVLSEIAPLSPEEGEAIRRRALDFEPYTLAAIFYTTVEGGEATGAVFDHGQLFKTIQNMAEWLYLDSDNLAITFLNWSYAPSLFAAFYYLVHGVTNVLGPGVETAVETMQQTSPTVTVTSPYFFEYFYDLIMDEVARMPASSREVFEWAVAKGKAFQAAGLSAPKELRKAYDRADMTFFSRIRGKVGGRMERFYSVGAPLSSSLVEFFAAVGFTVLNSYSVTGAGGFPAVSRPDTLRLGSCGQVAPGYQISINDGGEILVRGDTVMRGYWRQPQATREAVDGEGWLHTGDLGRFDRDGYLYITGHARHLVVLSTGLKVAPGVIERHLVADPLIAQAIVFGDGRPYVAALLVPEPEAVAERLGIEPADLDDEDGVARPDVQALFDEAVAEVNARLDSWERVEAFRLLAHPLPAEGEARVATVSGRHALTERYADHIAALYPIVPQMGEKQVTQVEISPERLRQLLEKETILDAWMADAGIEFLLELARRKHIDAPSMLHICDAAAAIAQMKREEKPLTTALVVGDPMQIARVLPKSEIQLLRSDHIRRMRKTLIALSRLVDGQVLAYVVDKHGYVRGIRKLAASLDNEAYGFLLGPQFRRHAAVSLLCNALVFFVPTGGQQARVFADGQLVGRYANGDWLPESMARVYGALAQLTKQRIHDPALLRRLLRCAFQMSEENLGGIFLVGDADFILNHSDPPETRRFATISSVPVDQLSDAELINFAKQDGATVIDQQGTFRGGMVLLRPAADTQAEIGPGMGARHSSAAKMSAEADCIAITVSQDGPISVYDGGKRVLSL